MDGLTSTYRLSLLSMNDMHPALSLLQAEPRAPVTRRRAGLRAPGAVVRRDAAVAGVPPTRGCERDDDDRTREADRAAGICHGVPRLPDAARPGVLRRVRRGHGSNWQLRIGVRDAAWRQVRR